MGSQQLHSPVKFWPGFGLFVGRAMGAGAVVLGPCPLVRGAPFVSVNVSMGSSSLVV